MNRIRLSLGTGERRNSMNIFEFVKKLYTESEPSDFSIKGKDSNIVQLSSLSERSADEIFEFLGVHERDFYGYPSVMIDSLTLLAIFKIIRILKMNYKRRTRTVKTYQCRYCLKEFESNTKKIQCPECKHAKDKECKRIWARNNKGRKKK